MVDVGINQKRTSAVVDTAAEITVMSETFAKSLQPDLTFGKDYVLKGAAKGQVFNARLARKILQVFNARPTRKIFYAIFVHT